MTGMPNIVRSVEIISKNLEKRMGKLDPRKY